MPTMPICAWRFSILALESAREFAAAVVISLIVKAGDIFNTNRERERYDSGANSILLLGAGSDILSAHAFEGVLVGNLFSDWGSRVYRALDCCCASRSRRV